jgi:hypothetical protein
MSLQIPSGSETIRPFLPTKDFEASKAVYEALGFRKVLDSDVVLRWSLTWISSPSPNEWQRPMKIANLVFACATLALLTVPQVGYGNAPRIAKGQFFSCAVPARFAIVDLWSDVPQILRDKFKDYAAIGDPWNAGDVMGGPEPASGVEFVLHRGKRWIIMVGHGGFGTSSETRAFELSKDRKTAVEIDPRVPMSASCSYVDLFARER